MTVKPLRCDDISFFNLANELGAPVPLRRILSLMRLAKCKTIILQENNPGINMECALADDRHCSSCIEHIAALSRFKSPKLQKKTCYKLFFFKSTITSISEITPEKESEFLGYCFVHKDLLLYNDDNEERVVCTAYVPEAVMNYVGRDIRGYKYGNFISEINIVGNTLKATGNYFAQQNRTTNCCAHAAIKAAIRAYYENANSRQINLSLGRTDDVLENYSGAGLKSRDVQKAIEDISNGDLKTFLLDANHIPTPVFLSSLYFAIESKIPVILLFTMPKDETRGHAMTVIGHTFNRHSWMAYGGNYFDQGKFAYVPSYHWCDKYVVQDDNYGPFYHIPTHFFTDYIEYAKSTKSYRDRMLSKIEIHNDAWSEFPLAAVFITPSKYNFIEETITFCEQYAITSLFDHIDVLSSEGDLPKNNKNFDLFFYNSFKEIIDRRECRLINNRSLITRTFLATKEEYLSGDMATIYRKAGLLEELKEKLPEVFILTDISVHELFWINEDKVGEIIVDPFELAKLKQQGNDGSYSAVKLIRIPYHLTLFDNDQCEERIELEQNSPHYKLTKKNKGLLRVAQEKR